MQLEVYVDPSFDISVELRAKDEKGSSWAYELDEKTFAQSRFKS